MSDDDQIIIVSQPEDPVVLVVDSQDSVLVAPVAEASVLVIHEGPQGPKGDPGDVPDWVTKTSITVSNTAPQSPNIGDLWVDTN
jgi:hypothetical protein